MGKDDMKSIAILLISIMLVISAAYPTWSNPSYACVGNWTQIQVEWKDPSALVLPFPYKPGERGGMLFVEHGVTYDTVDLIFDGFDGELYRWHGWTWTPDEPFDVAGYVHVKGGDIWIYPDKIYPLCWLEDLYLWLPLIQN